MSGGGLCLGRQGGFFFPAAASFIHFASIATKALREILQNLSLPRPSNAPFWRCAEGAVS